MRIKTRIDSEREKKKKNEKRSEEGRGCVGLHEEKRSSRDTPIK